MLNLKGIKQVSAPKRAKGAEKYTKIWDKAFHKFDADLNQSIREAEGRYGEGWEERAAGLAKVAVDADTVKTKAYKAPFWRPVYVEVLNGVQNPHPDTDRVEVKLKVGNSAWEILPDEDGKRYTAMTIHGNQLIDMLQRIRKWVDGWSKEEKQAFHDFAIKVKEPPADKKKEEKDKEFKYSEEEDRYVRR